MHLQLKHLPSQLEQHVCPILHELVDCIQRPGAQLDLHSLERVVATARKDAELVQKHSDAKSKVFVVTQAIPSTAALLAAANTRGLRRQHERK
jgi:hypothetical protein